MGRKKCPAEGSQVGSLVDALNRVVIVTIGPDQTKSTNEEHND